MDTKESKYLLKIEKEAYARYVTGGISSVLRDADLEYLFCVDCDVLTPEYNNNCLVCGQPFKRD